MTKEEFMALAAQKYEKLHELNKITDFYDYEKSFDEIWTEFGRESFEKYISNVPNDVKKKHPSNTIRKNSHL